MATLYLQEAAWLYGSDREEAASQDPVATDHGKQVWASVHRTTVTKGGCSTKESLSSWTGALVFLSL